ncbi:hypothetical protein I302_102206 [Kwoniella bestiolae CBS 10118]|uniref:EKC/KEOPS complex subunit CGI121 n=1 Tax=Kwoniella bestiolae CBS 10118 TaxID=1296100 RepID=A0A1B9GEJ9_9TREE|nr:hypothetical protein I302_00895 [Kwoniella bestiolae CBS 10118]OCF29391.1 hypothetical protein I302_00895 [Kwoniella bestiolae CBS 10118]
MESYTLPSFPPEYSTIHICLFENVRNSPEIKKRLITAATTKGEEGDKLRAEVDFGFLEGDVLVSKEHLLTSILTTLLYSFPSTSNSAGVDIPNIEPLSISSSSKPKPKTRTHNLHSELLLSLSPNNNITDSIRRHGISDTTTNLVVVKFTGPHTNQESVYQSIADVVQGNLVGWDQIQKKTDWGRVDKIYKLSELNSLKSSTTPDEILNKKISAVVSAVGIKNVI